MNSCFAWHKAKFVQTGFQGENVFPVYPIPSTSVYKDGGCSVVCSPELHVEYFAPRPFSFLKLLHVQSRCVLPCRYFCNVQPVVPGPPPLDTPPSRYPLLYVPCPLETSFVMCLLRNLPFSRPPRSLNRIYIHTFEGSDPPLDLWHCSLPEAVSTWL